MRIVKRSILLGLLAVTVVTSQSGCLMPIISYITAQFAPPKKVEAKYELPSGKTVLVLVENRTEAVSYESIMRKLTGSLNAELVKNDLVDKTIPYDDIIHFRLSTPGYHRMAIKEVCTKLDADMVIYVHIDKFLLRDDTSDVWHGQFATTVFVKDRESRLWPRDLPGGHVVEPIDRDLYTGSSPNYSERLASHLAAQMADRVAKLFYKHALTGVDAWAGRVTSDDEMLLH